MPVSCWPDLQATDHRNYKYIMIVRKLLCLTVLLAAIGCAPVLAQDASSQPQQRYQVEVIVLRHPADAEAATRVVETLNDYGQAVAVGEPGDELAPIQSLAERSLAMDGIWRRLNRGSRYEPLHYQGWIQTAAPPRNPYQVAVASELENAPTLSADARLAGTISLTESRFPVLSLDLELLLGGADIGEVEDSNSQETGGASDMESAIEANGGGLYEVQRFRQSRQIQEERLEYFDGPDMAVIARIEVLDDDADGPMDEEQASDQ